MNVVLVADMVRGFCEEGRSLYVGPSVREIIPRVRVLLQRETSAGSHISR
jgi:nicotinamidase-related amidase